MSPVQFPPSPAGGAVLTGFLSSTSLTLRFSNGMIPRGSLSWTSTKTTAQCWRSRSVATATEQHGSTHRGVLKVVEAVVGEDEPPPLPGLDPSACGAQSRRQSSSPEKRREASTEGPAQAAADRQTDV